MRLKLSKNEELIQVEKTRLSLYNDFYRHFYRETLDVAQNNSLDGKFEVQFVFNRARSVLLILLMTYSSFDCLNNATSYYSDF